MTHETFAEELGWADTNDRRKTIAVDLDVMLAFVQNSWDSTIEVLEVVIGAPVNDKATEIARGGFNKTWGDRLGVIIGENRKAKVSAPAELAEEGTKAEDEPDWVRQVSEILDEHAQARCPSEIEGWGCSLTNGHDGDHTAHDQDGPAYVWPASSPVVPAPTETGPWQRIEDVPEGVHRIFDGDRDLWVKADGVWYGGSDFFKVDGFGPFVAAEEK